MAIYDAHQQTFVLSMAINAAYELHKKSKTIERDLKAGLDDLLGKAEVRDLIGDWGIVWGPAVWQPGASFMTGYSANTMAVFRNPATNTYVCAIAATNAYSVFDWLIEDLWVGNQVRYQAAPAKGVPWISAATNFGIGMLSGLRDPGTGTFLVDFLNSIANGASTLIFTGHSLAGALSPSMAMTLYGTQQARLAWKEVLVFPTAGASPGNQDFSDAFAMQFPAITTGQQPWQRWNTLIWNDLDVIPHAWGWARMAQVPTIYDMTFGIRAEVLIAMCLGIYLAGWDYRGLPDQALKGTQKSGPIDSLGGFAEEMGYQHVDAYVELLGVTAMKPFMKPLTTDTIPDTAQISRAVDKAKGMSNEIASTGIEGKIRALVGDELAATLKSLF